MARFSDDDLRRLRNEISLPQLLEDLRWPHKLRHGQFVFVCPRCGESQSDHNPQENLIRCFACGTNFNPIDFTMLARDCDFVEAVHYLHRFLKKPK
jgi:DNA-directed RNA polymerase subunit RPC12/RpoP